MRNFKLFSIAAIVAVSLVAAGSAVSKPAPKLKEGLYCSVSNSKTGVSATCWFCNCAALAASL